MVGDGPDGAFEGGPARGDQSHETGARERARPHEDAMEPGFGRGQMGGAMIDGDFTPSFGLDGGRKDLALIVDAFRHNDVDASVIEAVKGLFDTASESGHGDDDLAAVYTALR